MLYLSPLDVVEIIKGGNVPLTIQIETIQDFEDEYDIVVKTWCEGRGDNILVAEQLEEYNADILSEMLFDKLIKFFKGCNVKRTFTDNTITSDYEW